MVWLSVARALDDVGHHVEALAAARSAIDLAGPETIAPALDVAIAASRALGRAAQVESLTAQRALVAQRTAHGDADEAARGARGASRSYPTRRPRRGCGWCRARIPRDLELTRRARAARSRPTIRAAATLDAELVALAGDRDPDRASAAVLALRR